MRAAIYARKSNDENGKTDDNKSVERQVDRARAYASAKGWTIDDEHIYVDDAISGAEYQNRPGFTRLLNHLGGFDALVMSESSRLGRDMLRNSYHLGEIIESGVRVFYYLTDEEEKLDTPEQKIMVTLKSYASEVERQKASQRARDALERKAQKGYNTGGRVYGYDNVWVYPDGRRTPAPPKTKGDGKARTEYQINEHEAEIVRAIYRAYAAGHGIKTIAKAVNGDPGYAHLSLCYFDGRRPPSPWKGTGSWAPSSVRAILHRERYTGVIPFGQHHKIYRKGTKTRQKQIDYLRVAAPELRIVDDALWRAVRERHAAAKKTYIRDTNGHLWGRPGMGAESKYLLTGLARCGCCESNIVALGRPSGSPRNRRRIFYYGCSYHNNRGRTVCANDTRVQMPAMDDAVLDAIETQILTSDAIAYTVERALAKLSERRRVNPERPRQIEAELKKLHRELTNLTAAIASGRAPKSVVDEITARESRIDALERERGQLASQELSELDLRRLRKSCAGRVGRFRDLIRSDVPLARQALSKLLAEPLRFTPVVREGRKTYAFEGKTRVGALLDPVYLEVASPRGFEPLLPP